MGTHEKRYTTHNTYSVRDHYDGKNTIFRKYSYASGIDRRKTANATLTCKRKKNRGPRIQLQIRKLSKFIKKKKEKIDKDILSIFLYYRDRKNRNGGNSLRFLPTTV